MLLFSEEIPNVSVDIAVTKAIIFCKLSPPSLLARLTMLNPAEGCYSPDIIERFSFMSADRSLAGTISAKEYLEISRWTFLIDTRPAAAFSEKHVSGAIWVEKVNAISFGLTKIINRYRFVAVMGSSIEQIEEVSLERLTFIVFVLTFGRISSKSCAD